MLAKTIGLVVGAIIALGCQGSKDASKNAAPAASNDTPQAVAATEPEATAAPETKAAAAEPEATGAPEEGAEEGELVASVKGLTQMRTVEQTDAGIRITYVLEQAVTVNEQSTPEEVSDAMMFAAFYTAPLLYGRLSDIDGLEQVFLYKGETIGTIQMTRASFESLGYADAMVGVTDKKAKRPIYRKLLSSLPNGAVQIEKKYRP